MRTVARIDVTPVKGFALDHPHEVTVDRAGVRENRRFFLVNEHGERLRSSLTAWPVVVRASYDADADRLVMEFPGGERIEGDARGAGDTFVCELAGKRMIETRIVDGPWTEPLSQLAGHPVRLARTEEPGRAFANPVTLVSEASIERLSREAGAPVDGRRFRMLFTLAGCDEHEEDEWDGRPLRIGDVVLRAGGRVERCAATTRHPDTGERDLDTLRLLASYRGVHDMAVFFGVYATVEEPGRVRVGDPVTLL